MKNPWSQGSWANMGPTWGRQDPGGSRVGPMSFAIWDVMDLSPGYCLPFQFVTKQHIYIHNICLVNGSDTYDKKNRENNTTSIVN